MSTLVLLPPTQADGTPKPIGAQSLMQFALVNASGMLTDQGRKRVAALPKAVETVLLLPGQWMSWHRVQLPKLDKKLPLPKLKALLGGVLEEHVLEDIGQLHFALPQSWYQRKNIKTKSAPVVANTQANAQTNIQTGASTTDAPDRTWVAATNKARLGHVLTELTAAGVDIDRILPQATPLATAGAQRVMVEGTPETAVVHYADSESVLSAPLTHWKALGLDIHDDTAVQAMPAVAELTEAHTGRSAQLMQAGQSLTQTLSSPWNLAQFDFAVSRHRWVRRLRKGFENFWGAESWRWARWALGATVLLNLVGLGVWQWQAKQRNVTQRTELVQAFRAAFPEARGPVPNPEQRAQVFLQKLERSRAGLRAQDLEPMLLASQSWMQNLPADVKLSFADGILGVTSPALAQQDVDAARATLSRKGYSLQVVAPTQWSVEVQP